MPQKSHTKKLIIPRRLRPGDTVGIVAPASPFDRELFYQGISELQAMGYRTSIPPELFVANGYLAGSDAQRAQLVNRFFSDSSIDAIIELYKKDIDRNIKSVNKYSACNSNHEI